MISPRRRAAASRSDFPFGLPAELCRDLGWPLEWKALVSHCSSLTRQQLRCALDAYRNSRPAGSKYAHRATDLRLRDDLERAVVGDGAADLLDAVICATQAAWAALRPRYGLPAGAFGAEGWIVSAGTSS